MYPLALSSASAFAALTGRAVATSTTGFCVRNASTRLPSKKTAPTAAANNPSRLPAFLAGREWSSIRSELRSCCGGIELPIKSRNPSLSFCADVHAARGDPGAEKLISGPDNRRTPEVREPRIPSSRLIQLPLVCLSNDNVSARAPLIGSCFFFVGAARCDACSSRGHRAQKDTVAPLP